MFQICTRRYKNNNFAPLRYRNDQVDQRHIKIGRRRAVLSVILAREHARFSSTTGSVSILRILPNM